jgi:hypothetical protein
MDQKLPVKVRFTDEDDNPVTIDSVPEWRISDDTMVMVEVAADNRSVWLFPVGPEGHARLAISADSFSGWFDIDIRETIVWETSVHNGPVTEIKLGNGKLRAVFLIGPAHHSHDCG